MLWYTSLHFSVLCTTCLQLWQQQDSNLPFPELPQKLSFLCSTAKKSTITRFQVTVPNTIIHIQVKWLTRYYPRSSHHSTILQQSHSFSFYVYYPGIITKDEGPIPHLLQNVFSNSIKEYLVMGVHSHSCYSQQISCQCCVLTCLSLSCWHEIS